MSQLFYDHFQSLRLRLQTDPEYQQLENQRRETEPAFLAALEALEPEKREHILVYFGILQEQGLREIELACFLAEEPANE